MKRIILLLTGILFLFTMSVTSPTFAQGGPVQGPEPSYDSGTKTHHVKKHKKHHKKHKKHKKHRKHRKHNTPPQAPRT